MAATPPRRPRTSRSARGLAWAAGLVLVLCAGLWGVAAVHFGRGLQVRLAALQQAGEPTTVEQLGQALPPPADDAAPLYVQLLQIDFRHATRPPEGLAGLCGADLEQLEAFRRQPAPAQARAAARLLSRPAAQSLLAGLQAASGRPQAVFPLRWSEGFSARSPHLARLRAAGRLLLAAALAEAFAGRHEAAGQHLLAALRLARQVSQEPSLLAQPAAYALYGLAADTAPQVLRVCPLAPAERGRLQEELRRADLQGRLRLALRSERVLGLEMFRQATEDPARLGTGGLSTGAPLAPALSLLSRSIFSRPFWQMQQVLYLDRFEPLLRQAERPYRDLPAPQPLPPVRPWDIASVPLPALHKLALARDLALARLGMMQLALDLQGYHQAHGRYPRTLAALGGAEPGDPFSSGPFIYRPEAEGYLLYSLGGNLRDDSGTPLNPDQGPQVGDIVWGHSAVARGTAETEPPQLHPGGQPAS